VTYLVYALWFLSLLAVAGELDRRWGRRFSDRVLPELAISHIWFLPPAASMVVPGSGQLLNGQPIKALFCFLWPFTITAIPRPWQMVALKLWWLAAPWYVFVILDALIYSLMRHRDRHRHEAQGCVSEMGAAHALQLYLVRRSRDRGPDRSP